ncbi:MAG: hypothetical protein LBR34_04820 [Prevotella sp.]|jgi:hypothetical protein|nr:hypothetical protein [Prevotella sp.]
MKTLLLLSLAAIVLVAAYLLNVFFSTRRKDAELFPKMQNRTIMQYAHFVAMVFLWHIYKRIIGA